MNTMVTDHEVEAQLAEDAGHTIECFEVWAETALEAGIDGAEIYALWIEQAGNGFRRKNLGKCTCEVDGMQVTEMIKALKKLGYKVSK